MVGPAYANACHSYVDSLTWGKSRCRRPGTSETGWYSDDRYPGAMLCRHFNTWAQSLNRFRLCAHVFKCLHNMAPGYLSSLWLTTSSQCNWLCWNWCSPMIWY